MMVTQQLGPGIPRQHRRDKKWQASEDSASVEVRTGVAGSMEHAQASAPSRRRDRQAVKRSRTIRFDLTEAEFGEIRAAADQAGLARGAFAARAALVVARGGGLPDDCPRRRALGEFIRAAGLVRRI